MNRGVVECGFIPLVDAAPLVVAREFGFAAEEGLDLRLRRQPSWSALRDRLALGAIDAAHVLSPMPIAMALKVGGVAADVDVLSILSVNGNFIGGTLDLTRRMREAGWSSDIWDAGDALAAFARVAQEGPPIRIGTPFPASMHVELLRYWLAAAGLEPDARGDGPGVRLRTIPPPRMVSALEAGEVDAFCVGEPWGGLAEERGGAELILPTAAIWAFAPEKALAARSAWVRANPEDAGRLMRAVWRAARWLADPSRLMAATEVLARPDYVDAPSDVIERALSGRNAGRGRRPADARVIEFYAAAATFPWRSHAVWLADRLAERHGLNREAARARARGAYRSDLYRSVLAPIGADVPAASEKVEGALDSATPVASSRGDMVLGPDRFFDGRVFDPLPPPNGDQSPKF